RARRVTADNKFLPLVQAHFLPRAGTLARFVSTVQTFRHQSLESLGSHGRHQVSKICIEHRRLANRLAPLSQNLMAKDLPSADQGLRHHISSDENQNVENVDQRRTSGSIIL